jgi:ketopantoate reductase PanE/ApbA-like protein
MAAGAVGGYFGWRVAAAGHDVAFIARGAHRDAIRRAKQEIYGRARPAVISLRIRSTCRASRRSPISLPRQLRQLGEVRSDVPRLSEKLVERHWQWLAGICC